MVGKPTTLYNESGALRVITWTVSRQIQESSEALAAFGVVDGPRRVTVFIASQMIDAAIVGKAGRLTDKRCSLDIDAGVGGHSRRHGRGRSLRSRRDLIERFINDRATTSR